MMIQITFFLILHFTIKLRLVLQLFSNIGLQLNKLVYRYPLIANFIWQGKIPKYESENATPNIGYNKSITQ